MLVSPHTRTQCSTVVRQWVKNMLITSLWSFSFSFFPEGRLCQTQQNRFQRLKWNAPETQKELCFLIPSIFGRVSIILLRLCLCARVSNFLGQRTSFTPAQAHPPTYTQLSLSLCNVVNSLVIWQQNSNKNQVTPTCLHVRRLLLQRFARSSHSPGAESRFTIILSPSHNYRPVVHSLIWSECEMRLQKIYCKNKTWARV